MRKVRYSEGGEKFLFSPTPSPVRYPESEVQPDQSLPIREIYYRWRHNQPTTVHPFACEFDENADDIDYDDEMPIDRAQFENKVANLQDAMEADKEESKARKKAKKDSEKEQDSFIDKLSKKLSKTTE